VFCLARLQAIAVGSIIVQCVDPWKSNETFVAVLVEVDGDDPVNQQTSQQLGQSGVIETLPVVIALFRERRKHTSFNDITGKYNIQLPRGTAGLRTIRRQAKTVTSPQHVACGE